MRYRSLWISDVHLGRLSCQAEQLNDFLRCHESERLYLVGDIVDGWKLREHWYWPQSHANVLRQILSKAENGTAVHYITGNHDDFVRRHLDHPTRFGNIHIGDEAVHHTADGRRLLVVHGDSYDRITRQFRRLAIAGDNAYQLLMRHNGWINAVRARRGLPYWSLSAYVKQQVKQAVNFVSLFEETVARDCRRRGLDGVICGHIHHAEIRDILGVEYHNCGDWVESCTALGEDSNGRISIIRWGSSESVPLSPNGHVKTTPLRRAAGQPHRSPVL